MAAIDDAYTDCTSSFSDLTAAISILTASTDRIASGVSGLEDGYVLMEACVDSNSGTICELKQDIEESQEHSDSISNVLEDDGDGGDELVEPDTSYDQGNGISFHIEKLKKALLDVQTDEQKKISRLRKKIAYLKIKKLSAEKRKEYLENNMPEDETISAWCADLTEDLAGEVGTVEIPGESVDIQVQPGYDGNAAYNQDRDGQLLPTVVNTPAQAFYNLAMMPGWQKWKPLFRYATIDAVNGDKADITLGNTTSSQQSLDINQAGTISDVDIEYMSCNGAAFEEGDDVLVKFTGQAWENPIIIGFKEDPQPCDLDPILVIWDYYTSKRIFFNLLTGELEPIYLKSDPGVEIEQPTTFNTGDLTIENKLKDVSYSMILENYDPDTELNKMPDENNTTSDVSFNSYDQTVSCTCINDEGDEVTHQRTCEGVVRTAEGSGNFVNSHYVWDGLDLIKFKTVVNVVRDKAESWDLTFWSLSGGSCDCDLPSPSIVTLYSAKERNRTKDNNEAVYPAQIRSEYCPAEEKFTIFKEQKEYSEWETVSGSRDITVCHLDTGYNLNNGFADFKSIDYTIYGIKKDEFFNESYETEYNLPDLPVKTLASRIGGDKEAAVIIEKVCVEEEYTKHACGGIYYATQEKPENPETAIWHLSLSDFTGTITMAEIMNYLEIHDDDISGVGFTLFDN